MFYGKKNCPPNFCISVPNENQCILLSENQIVQLAHILQSLIETLPALFMSPTPQNIAAVRLLINELLIFFNSGYINIEQKIPPITMLNNLLFILNNSTFSPLIFTIELQKLVNQSGIFVNLLCSSQAVKQSLLALLQGILAVLIQFGPNGRTYWFHRIYWFYRTNWLHRTNGTG
ncbi:TPA: collagen-like repeat preface domain-containing protein [Bacillus toyonensis]|nr:collagen-like repeat preface domain-containing protein [Bacillus toyonensis]